MRIAILTLGTRGDLQPYLALAKGLIARGHSVTLAGPDNFAAWTAAHHVPFAPIGVDMEAFLKSDEARQALAGSWFGVIKIWRSKITPMFRATLDAAWAAGRDADVLIYHPKLFAAADIAEATGATPILATPIPMFRTSAFPAIIFSRSLGGWLNRQSHRMFDLSRLVYTKSLNRWRRDSLGLGPGPSCARLAQVTTGKAADGKAGTYMATRLCAVSPSVLPRPTDWDEGIHLTGYWFLDEGAAWRPDPALAAFLAAGEPPVYAGFGSMTHQDPEALTRKIIHAAAQAGVRLLLASGWGGIESVASDTVHPLSSAPHDALFPQVAAVVHHGGAGTTAAGLRAGRPSLICPLSVDQPFWGRRVHNLGCGPEPLPLKQLTADALATRLQDLVANPAYHARAQVIAAQIAKEDGVARAIEIIEAKPPRR